MSDYVVNIAGFGLSDEYLESIPSDLEIKKKGDIANKRTGKKFEENIIKIIDSTTYEVG